jgi:hypothetical protein
MITQTLAVITLLVVGLAAFAQAPEEAAEETTSVTLHMEDSRLSRVLREIERVSGRTVSCDKALRKVQVSLRVDDLAWDRLAALVGFALDLDPVAAGSDLEFASGGETSISALDITQCRRPELDGSRSFTILRFTSEDDFSSETVKDMGPATGFVRIRRCGEGHRNNTTASRGDGKG